MSAVEDAGLATDQTGGTNWGGSTDAVPHAHPFGSLTNGYLAVSVHVRNGNVTPTGVTCGGVAMSMVSSTPDVTNGQCQSVWVLAMGTVASGSQNIRATFAVTQRGSMESVSAGGAAQSPTWTSGTTFQTAQGTTNPTGQSTIGAPTNGLLISFCQSYVGGTPTGGPTNASGTAAVTAGFDATFGYTFGATYSTSATSSAWTQATGSLHEIYVTDLAIAPAGATVTPSTFSVSDPSLSRIPGIH